MPELEAIGVIVADLERSIRFYAQLGLNFPEPADPQGHGHIEATLPSGLRFMLDTEASVRSFAPDWQPPAGGYRIVPAFRCESGADVDRLYRELLDHGGTARTPPWDAFWGQRYAQVLDPDGSVVDLFAPIRS